MLTCPNCAEDNPERARFCLACGTSLASAPPARETRKVVTVVFCDVTGSTSLGEELDPETLRRVMGRYFDEMQAVIERHGGVVEKFIGDAVMAVFGIPQLHEDDALRAVRAAAEMGERLEKLNSELQRDRGVRIVVRTGVNTGEVVAGDPSTGQRLVTGDAVNVAARLEQAGPPGQILLGETTHRLVRDAVSVEPLEPLSLKGKADPVPAFRLREVIEGAEAHTRRFDSPMVGRQREQLALQQAFERTVSERTCHLFTVLGAAGVGKSRLVQEFLGSTPPGTQVLRGRCLSYGDGITFWPVSEVVREAAGILDDDSQDAARAKLDALLALADDGPLIAPRIAEIVGLPSAGSTPEETFWAVRKLFEALATARPLVVVFDDIHWGEPTFLDLIEHVADWSRDAPILLLCPARPEMLDRRPNWAGGKMNATSILLEPLPGADCMTLIGNLLGATELSEDARGRIVDAAEGNPLFVEEMLAMLIDDGLLRREGGTWVPLGDLSEVLVPPTIHALLAARLDRLDPEERDVIERGAVEGKVFHRGAVANLSPDEARQGVGPRLLTLTRKELIRPDRAEFAGEDAFRFRHQLIRDAAYQGMSKESRATLHERFADWLERAAGERLPEYEEILGYHLEQAYRYRQELGPMDDTGRALARRAADRLAASGRRALARGDLPAAKRLLTRAADLLIFDTAARVRIAPDLGEALSDLGELHAANEVLAEAKAAAAGLGDRHTEALAEVRLAWLETSLLTHVGEADAEARIRQAMSVLEDSGDELGALRARSVVAFFTFTQGRAGEALRLHDEVRAGAERLGHGRIALASNAYRLGAMHFGPTPAEEGVAHLRAAFEEAAGDRRLEASAAQGIGGMLGYLGRFDEARAWAAEARSRFEELGMLFAARSRAAAFAAAIEVLAGDLGAADAIIRPHYEFLAAANEKGFLSTTAADLAEVAYGLGQYEEAERLAEESREAAGEDDVASQAEWRSVKAKVLANRGEYQEAERMAREAVAIIGQTDYVDYHGRFLLDLAQALRMGGRHGETQPILNEALHLFERKQNLVLAARTRSLLEDLGPSA